MYNVYSMHTTDSKMCENYVVYWFYLSHHTDPCTQGYIGITNNFARRLKEHFRSTATLSTHFANALHKYGKDKIRYKILHKCSFDEALQLECAYRPDLNIGWNYAIGGQDTLASVQSVPVTLYHQDNPKQLYTFKSSVEASNQLGISDSRIRQAVYRKSPCYGLDGWAVLHDPTYDTALTPTLGEFRSKLFKGTTRPKPSHFKGMTGRWSEADKQRISQQHKGKVISEHQKEIVRKKNRQSHSMCKPITLVHKNEPSKHYRFHSISEASRQLGIPLPTLKSKAQRPLNRFGKDGWAITHLGTE